MRRLLARGRRHGGVLAMAGVLAVLFAYPVLRFLLLPLFPGLGPIGGGVLAGGIPDLPAAAIFNTLRLGLAAALLVLPPGLALGFLLERRDWAGRGLVMLLVWAVLLMPSYLMTTGWQIVFALPALRDGSIHALFFSPAGIVAMLALKGMPFACLAARAGWAAIGGEMEDAARIHVGSAWRRAAILLRLMLPACASIFAVVFIEAIQDFGVAATLGARLHFPLVIYAIYARLATTPVDFPGAAVLSWLLVVFSAGAVAIHLRLGARFTAGLLHGRRRETTRPPCGAAGQAGGALAVLLLAGLGIGFPAVALVVEATAPGAGAGAGAGIDAAGWQSLLDSGLYGFVAAVVATLLAAGLVSLGRRGGRGMGRAIDMLTLGNMAVPGIVLGAAYVIAFNAPGLPLYGTPLLLVMAYVAGAMPMLVRFLQAPLGQLHANLGDAAALHGMGWWARLTDIHLPLLLRPLAWGFCMAFGGVFFELPISELLYPAERAPLGVQLLSLDETLHYAAEARLAMAGVLLCLAVVGAASLFAYQAPRRADPARHGAAGALPAATEEPA